MRRSTPHKPLPLTDKAAHYRWSSLQYLAWVSGLMALGLAHAVSASASDSQTAKSGEAKAPQEIPYMQMSVGERHYKIRLADTEAARAFSSLIPLTLEMADLNSDEKYVWACPVTADAKTVELPTTRHRQHASSTGLRPSL